MPAWKPAYLIHGDDHGRIAERRQAFRTAAEAESGAGGIEFLEGESATADAIAATLAAMTFAVGRRFVLIEGAEQLSDADVKDHLAPAIAAIAPDTTVAFFAREDGRRKAPKLLHAAIREAGGDVVAHETVKPRQLPTWAQQQSRRIGIELDGAGARMLVDQVGNRQQRLLRELEKLALEYGDGARIGAEEVEQAAASSSERQVWDLVDGLVAMDAGVALRRYLELAEQGEAVGRLVATMAQRVRQVLEIALRLQSGESPAQIKQSTKGSPWAIDHRIREARSADVESLRRLVEFVATLELDIRGMSDLENDTSLVLGLAGMARS